MWLAITSIPPPPTAVRRGEHGRESKQHRRKAPQRLTDNQQRARQHEHPKGDDRGQRCRPAVVTGARQASNAATTAAAALIANA
jgi:hypothetical protein